MGLLARRRVFQGARDVFGCGPSLYGTEVLNGIIRVVGERHDNGRAGSTLRNGRGAPRQRDHLYRAEVAHQRLVWRRPSGTGFGVRRPSAELSTSRSAANRGNGWDARIRT